MRMVFLFRIPLFPFKPWMVALHTVAGKLRLVHISGKRGKHRKKFDLKLPPLSPFKQWLLELLLVRFVVCLPIILLCHIEWEKGFWVVYKRVLYFRNSCTVRGITPKGLVATIALALVTKICTFKSLGIVLFLALYFSILECKVGYFWVRFC